MRSLTPSHVPVPLDLFLLVHPKDDSPGKCCPAVLPGGPTPWVDAAQGYRQCGCLCVAVDRKLVPILSTLCRAPLTVFRPRTFGPGLLLCQTPSKSIPTVRACVLPARGGHSLAVQSHSSRSTLVSVIGLFHSPGPAERSAHCVMKSSSDSRSAALTASQRAHAVGSISDLISSSTRSRRTFGSIASSSQHRLP
jgi:hypothetical protein